MPLTVGGMVRDTIHEHKCHVWLMDFLLVTTLFRILILIYLNIFGAADRVLQQPHVYMAIFMQLYLWFSPKRSHWCHCSEEV